MIKPGYTTTEFWTTLAGQLLAFLTILGVVQASDASALQDAFSKCIAAIFVLITNAWAVVDAKMTVTSAAREAARSYVEASDDASGRNRADAAARDAVSAHGRNPARAIVTGPRAADAFTRCSQISFTVSFRATGSG